VKYCIATTKQLVLNLLFLSPQAAVGEKFFLKFQKKMGDDVKKVEKHWFMILHVNNKKLKPNILVLPMQKTRK